MHQSSTKFAMLSEASFEASRTIARIPHDTNHLRIALTKHFARPAHQNSENKALGFGATNAAPATLPTPVQGNS